MSIIVHTAMQCLETPFKHQGRIKGLGMDCVGLYVYICQTLGVEHQDATGYPRTPYDGELERQLDAQPRLARIQPKEAEAGDILCMRLHSAPQHIAIHAGEIDGCIYIIHASEEHGKVALHRLDDIWRGRVVRAYRLRVFNES